MWRSPARLTLILCASLAASACASGDTIHERSYPSNEFSTTSPRARVELVRAAYLPRGVEFEVVLTNLEDTALSLDREGILLSYQGLEYPLDLASDDTPRGSKTPVMRDDVPPRISVAPGAQYPLRLAFRLGRPLTETAWVVLRTVAVDGSFDDPLWLEVPAAPPRKTVSSRPKRNTP